MNAISSDALSKLGLTAATKKAPSNAAAAQIEGADGNTPQKEKLGQADFLLMMTEQLKNQDPLNPMDNGAFLAQLAQFSQVQGLGDLNKKADQFLTSMDSDQAMRGAALIGRKVSVPGGGLELGGSGNAGGSVQVTAKGPVNVVVQDANGVPVRSITLPDAEIGQQSFSWDGNNDAGVRLPPGNYHFAASQSDPDGKPVKLDTYTNATVESVSLGKDGARLNIQGGGTVDLKEVQRIS